ncbi:hypothetical protein AXG93_3426s1010 [Marchantia polymorpha subsp. ruderalis]|uniref:Uncharacterized protein n=1 Tax=Marchantia polymorpha subsp. ruderalis TaxID=1480154 RepID=A0A176VBX2_MARPO|nr:hypothetical protein AXG93_3426s1010 [Marchantia polymorpha subsp. ruderalis]
MSAMTVLDIRLSSIGQVKIDKLLANPTMISRNVNSGAQNGREKLHLVIKKHFDSGLNLKYTLDLWIIAIKNNLYMFIIIHCIDEMFILHASTLHVKPIEEANQTMKMVLDEFNVTFALKKFKHPTLLKVVWWRHVILDHLRLVRSDVMDEDGNMTTAKNSDSIKIKQVQEKLKDAMIKYALLDNKEEDVPPARSSIKKKSRSSMLMYDQMLNNNEENNVPLVECHDAVAILNTRVNND